VNRLIRITASVAATLALTAPAAAQISTPAPSPWSVVKMVFGTGDGTLGTAVAMTETVVALGESGASSAAGQVRIVRKKAVDDSWVEAEILTPATPRPAIASAPRSPSPATSCSSQPPTRATARSTSTRATAASSPT